MLGRSYLLPSHVAFTLPLSVTAEEAGIRPEEVNRKNIIYSYSNWISTINPFKEKKMSKVERKDSAKTHFGIVPSLENRVQRLLWTLRDLFTERN